MSYFYFVSFQIAGAYIILNLFIAIILESYQKTELEADMRIGDETIAVFIKHWKELDPDASGYIIVQDLEILLRRLSEQEIKLVESDHDDEHSEKTFLFNLHKNDNWLGYVKYKM
jgi:hypothetical protein